MSKPDSYGAGLLPVALAAGLLSGSFFRQPPAPEATKPLAKPVEPIAVEDTTSPAWLSDLRPVMEVMGEALGVSVQRDAINRTSRAMADGIADTAPSFASAAAALNVAMQQRPGPGAAVCQPTKSSLSGAERTLRAYLLSEQDGTSPSRKLRASVAEAALNQLEDWRALETLTDRLDHYSVDFIVATMPDYVDSNAGWFADQFLAAIQSGMSRADHLLDRFKLIDWSRNDARADNAVANNSRLHERQPGALVFRKVDGRAIHVVVVLLALETPTSGVHRIALRNAIRFVRAWNRCAAIGTRPLKVLGPTFSGSTTSLALTLGDADERFVDSFPTIRVVSGSATADDNPDRFKDFAGANVTFAATVQPTSQIRRVMADFLGRMNPEWRDGSKVALLEEGNTAFGAASEKVVETRTQYGAASEKPGDPPPFQKASVFKFPLHVAQLRNDAPATTAAITLLPTQVVPLNLRETTPPADQIPALRPQLTSSVVESTVSSILDTIRHERLTAVGIQATDDRDVLFLAREVKRAVPDVQLFLLGAHALYLHPDYVPHLRGTLVASSYSLSLMTQKPRHLTLLRREPFQSMAAQGVFNATLDLMGRQRELIDYCAPGNSAAKCMPPVWVSVIGQDGFWPIEFQSAERSYALSVPSIPTDGSSLPPLPTPARIIALVLALLIIGQVATITFVRTRIKARVPAKYFLQWPILRVLAPPLTYGSAASAHRFTFVLCFVPVAFLFAWMAAVLLPFGVPGQNRLLILLGVGLAAGVVLIPVAQLSRTAGQAKRLPGSWPAAAQTRASRLLMPVLVLLLVTLGAFVVYVGGLVWPDTAPELHMALARVVGGGVVSPAMVTIGLFAALYASLFTSMRRASLVGNGYALLEKGSAAFALFNDGNGQVEPQGKHRRHSMRLGDVLDLPAQNLPLPFLVLTLLGTVIAAISVRHVSTADGRAFTLFLAAGSVTVLTLGFVNLAQGAAIWTTARARLKRLALSPIADAVTSVGHLVPWNLSLAPPRLIELMPVARRADTIVAELRAMTGLAEAGRLRGAEDGGHRRWTPVECHAVEARLGLRRGDLDRVVNRSNALSTAARLDREMHDYPQAAFIQSTSWLQLWKVADAIVDVLNNSLWRRSAPVRQHSAACASLDVPVVFSVSQLPESIVPVGTMASVVKVGGVLEAKAVALTEPPAQRAEVFRRWEEFVALQFAFVLRDVVARTLSALFTAMLCLTLLTASHLLYSFNGRSALLTVDLLAVGAAALTSLWILIGMERETVLSRLRNTTPGKLDFNWGFLQRVAVYGVIPLLAVIGALFPEIGSSLFGWLEPLRKVTSF